MRHERAPWWALGVFAVAVVGFFWWQWSLNDPQAMGNRGSYWAWPTAIVAMALGWVLTWWLARRPEDLDIAAGRLAIEVAAARRRFLKSALGQGLDPARARYTPLSAEELAPSVAQLLVRWQPLGNPGERAGGTAGELHGLFAGLNPPRLLIAGPPGGGKTVLATQLTQALLLEALPKGNVRPATGCRCG